MLIQIFSGCKWNRKLGIIDCTLVKSQGRNEWGKGNCQKVLMPIIDLAEVKGERRKDTFGNCYKLKVQKGQKAPNVRLVSM